ncbi:hypothetical protein JXA40_05500 [bacterium]|nr:hypothetical protein [candidate division CSSED10-310 bacterium]
MVNIDATVFVEIALFILLVLVLNILLFRPVLGIMAKRRQKLIGEREDSEKLEKSAAELQSEAEDALNQTRKSVREKILSAAAEQEKKKNALIQDEEQHSETEMEWFRAEINRSVEQTRVDLVTRFGDLTESVLKKLLPLLLGLFLWETSVQASGGGGISEVARTVDFVIMVAILVFLLRKPLSGALKNRTRSIRNQFENSAARLKTALDGMRAAAFEKERIPDQEQAIVSQGEDEIRKIRERLALEIREETRKIREKSEQLKRREQLNARQGLLRSAVSETIQQVQEHLREGIPLQTDRKLVADFLDRMDAMASEPGESFHA